MKAMLSVEMGGATVEATFEDKEKIYKLLKTILDVDFDNMEDLDMEEDDNLDDLEDDLDLEEDVMGLCGKVIQGVNLENGDAFVYYPDFSNKNDFTLCRASNVRKARNLHGDMTVYLTATVLRVDLQPDKRCKDMEMSFRENDLVELLNE